MSDPLNQLQELKRITLNDDARARIRGRLELFVSLKPRDKARAGIVYASETQPVFEWSVFLHAWYTRALLTALFLVVGGSVTINAAEGALPGDMLYPIKVHVNEETQALFARGDARRATVEVSRLSRRLQEVEQLASQGLLTSEKEAVLVEQIEDHSKTARKHITNAIELKPPSVAVVRVQNELISTIAAHDGMLSDLIKRPRQDHPEPLTQVRSILESEKVAAGTTGIGVAAAASSPLLLMPDELGKRLAVLAVRLDELVTLFEERVLPGDISRTQVDQLLRDADTARQRSNHALAEDNIITATVSLFDSERALFELETFAASSKEPELAVEVAGTSTLPEINNGTTTTEESDV